VELLKEGELERHSRVFKEETAMNECEGGEGGEETSFIPEIQQHRNEKKRDHQAAQEKKQDTAGKAPQYKGKVGSTSSSRAADECEPRALDKPPQKVNVRSKRYRGILEEKRTRLAGNQSQGFWQSHKRKRKKSGKKVTDGMPKQTEKVKGQKAKLELQINLFGN